MAITKHTAVVCNNPAEWKHFTESLVWNLSKQNKPYKLTEKELVDIQNNQKFIHVPRNMYKLSETLYMYADDCFNIDNVIFMCDHNKEIEDYLNNWRMNEIQYCFI